MVYDRYAHYFFQRGINGAPKGHKGHQRGQTSIGITKRSGKIWDTYGTYETSINKFPKESAISFLHDTGLPCTFPHPPPTAARVRSPELCSTSPPARSGSPGVYCTGPDNRKSFRILCVNRAHAGNHRIDDILVVILLGVILTLMSTISQKTNAMIINIGLQIDR